MDKTKPYDIPKQTVWEAYKRVKANKGAAGIDDETIEKFEEDLKGNLYKIWNRMSSGSYLPPPVRLLEIPKGNGGHGPPWPPPGSGAGGGGGGGRGAERTPPSPWWNRCSTRARMAIDPADLRSMPSGWQGSDAGMP